MPRGVPAIFFLIIVAGVCPAIQSGEPFKPGKLPKEEIDKLDQGLTLRFLSAGRAAPVLDARRVRLAALHVPEGSPPSTRVRPGTFEAEFVGLFKVAAKAEYTF